MIIRAPVPRGRIRHDDRDGIPAALLRSSHSAQKNSIFLMAVTLRTRFIRAAKTWSTLLGSTETPEPSPGYRPVALKYFFSWSDSVLPDLPVSPVGFQGIGCAGQARA